jgi:hypothetical protein
MCLNCGEHEAPGGRGYCPVCLIAVRAEIEQGLLDLEEYLTAWAAFGQWCDLRGLSTA